MRVNLKSLAFVAIAALAAAASAQTHDTPQNLPITAPAAGPNQILFGGNVIDGIPPEAHRLTPAALLKRVLQHPLPTFPPTAKLYAGVLVQVLVLVGPDGAVASILGVDGPAELTSAATSAVQQWTFQPFPGKGPAAQMTGIVNLLFTPAAGSDPAAVTLLPGLIRISGGVLAGNNTHKVLAAGTHGVDVFHVLIDPHGSVAAVNPVSGPLADRDAWTSAVAQWRYRPYLLNGEPVWVESTISVVDH